MTVALVALVACKKKGPEPPECDSTECCELFQQQVFDDCSSEQDEVYGCGKNAKHAFEACMQQVR